MVKKIVFPFVLFLFVYAHSYAAIAKPDERQLKNFGKIQKWIEDGWEKEKQADLNITVKQWLDKIILIRVEDRNEGEVYLVNINFMILAIFGRKAIAGGLMFQKLLFLFDSKTNEMAGWDSMPAEMTEIFTSEQLRQMTQDI